MKQKTTLEKQRKGKSVTDSALIARLKDRLYPMLMLLSKTKVKYKVHAVNPCISLPDRPIIFAANHSAFQDTPIALKVTGRRSYIFAGKQNLTFLDWLFFTLNGSIWVDRKNKEDLTAAKSALLAYLSRGESILWFPEGTWNLTDNLLMLPMKWGIIDIATKAGAQIVPLALDYNRNDMTCYVSFGEPIVPNDVINKADAIRNLRDTIATLRWELWEKRPPLTEYDKQELKAEVYAALTEYPPLDWNYESSIIFQPYEPPQRAFAHLKQIEPQNKNAFLFKGDKE